MTQPHRQCAASLILDPAGRALLVQQNYGGRRWSAPGGVVDPGETPMQTAQREALEEVGVEIRITGVVGLYLLQGGGWPDILSHIFQAEIVQGIAHVVDPKEIAAVEWCRPTPVLLPMTHDVEAGLSDLWAGRTGVVRTIKRRGTMEPFTLF